MFNNKRIEGLQRSVRALKHMVDMQNDDLTMLVKYLGVEYVPSTATLPSYQKIKKEKK